MNRKEEFLDWTFKSNQIENKKKELKDMENSLEFIGNNINKVEENKNNCSDLVEFLAIEYNELYEQILNKRLEINELEKNVIEYELKWFNED